MNLSVKPNNNNINITATIPIKENKIDVPPKQDIKEEIKDIVIPKDDIILVIDGDTIVFAIACVMQVKYKALYDDLSLMFDKDYAEECITDMQNEDFKKIDENSLNLLKVKLNELFNYSKCNSYILYVGGSNNYRRVINQNYKVHRKTKELPIALKRIRQLLVDNYKADVVTEIETDDACCITYKSLQDAGYNVILAHCDKDLNQMQGTHLKIPTYYSPEIIIYNISEKEALYNVNFQSVKGDSTDNISGLKGIGEMKAIPIAEKGAINVHQEYIKAYGEIMGTYYYCTNYLQVFLLRNTVYKPFNIGNINDL